MNLTDISNSVRRNTKEHSPIILSVMAGAGTLTTSYLVGKASFTACRVIDNDPWWSEDRKERAIYRTKQVWKLYIPAAISGTSTIACIIGANRIGTRKTLAAQTALAVSQQVYSEYRDKVIEEYGARKDQSIRDKIAEERIKNNPPGETIIAGNGSVICCELFTGRYFNSDMETLRKSVNDLNVKLLSQDYATFDDFYYMVGLPSTSNSSQIGWQSGRLMELQFTSVLNDDGRPCLAFDYNYTNTF